MACLLALTIVAPTLSAQNKPITVASSSSAKARSNVLAQLVTIDLQRVPIKDAVVRLAKAAKVRVQFQQEMLGTSLVTLNAKRTTLGEAFNTLLRGTGLEAVPLTADAIGIQMVVSSDSADAQTITIVGRVTGVDSKDGIVGATVSIEGTKVNVLTGTDGKFQLNGVPSGARVVLVRLFGYVPERRTVNVEKGQQLTLNIALATATTQLASVVTTATGEQKRYEVGNDIVSINVDEAMKNAPVTTISELLETRVPGMVVQHTSGTPGSGSRLRLRGAGSITRSNDPILVVDGIRMNSAFEGSNRPAAIDQIDLNSIEKIEVLKGPSAAALYGSDAANGVIVVHTKRGQVGPTRWTTSLGLGIDKLPGRYAQSTYVFGHTLNEDSRLLRLQDYSNYEGIVIDSIVKFQALGDPRYSTVQGHGTTKDVSVSVSGGSGTMTYALTATKSNKTGIARLPDIEIERFQYYHGFGAPGWMRNPDSYGTWGLQSNLMTNLGKKPGANISLSNSLFNSIQQKSSMGDVLGRLMTTYIDTATFGPDGIVDATTRIRNASINSATSMRADYPFASWISVGSTAGLSNYSTTNASVTPRGYKLQGPDTAGHYEGSQQDVTSKTLGVQSTMVLPIGWGKTLRVIAGANVVQNATVNRTMNADRLNSGTMEPDVLQAGTLRTDGSTTYGWYLEPQINLSQRFFINPGFRLDGGSTPGSTSRGLASLTRFPKINTSWLVSDESFFPTQNIVTVLRLRAAFGYAGVLPGTMDRPRLYSECVSVGCEAQAYGTTGSINGHDNVPVMQLRSFGNTKLRPERSRETELGFDTELWQGRFVLSFSGYEKVQTDAIISVATAPSIGQGSGNKVNIGVVRNAGVEATSLFRIFDAPSIGWDVSTTLASNSNKVIKLSNGIEVGGIVEGYPLNGVWAAPIVSYADENDDGIISSSEVRVADSTVYIGKQEPTYVMNFSSSVRLFNDRLQLSSEISYQSGMLQMLNMSGSYPLDTFLGALDPRTPLEWQAALAARSAYSRSQNVNQLRWNSMAVRYTVPAYVARKVWARQMSITLQASNLGLRSNYRGIDPNVASFSGSGGNQFYDNGIQPQPRLWKLRANMGW